MSFLQTQEGCQTRWVSRLWRADSSLGEATRAAWDYNSSHPEKPEQEIPVSPALLLSTVTNQDYPAHPPNTQLIPADHRICLPSACAPSPRSPASMPGSHHLVPLQHRASLFVSRKCRGRGSQCRCGRQRGSAYQDAEDTGNREKQQVKSWPSKPGM